MSTPYLGEVRLFAGNFAPRTYALCQAQQLAISQNTALFSLLGTFYGGNGTTTFALPDSRGRLPVSFGQGPGLSNYTIGEQIGTETVTLNSSQMPIHTHVMTATTANAGVATPAGNMFAALQSPWTHFWTADAKKTGTSEMLNTQMVHTAGGNQPHENTMPTLAISFIIALQGIFPSRN